MLNYLFLIGLVNIIGNFSIISDTTKKIRIRQRAKLFNLSVGLGGVLVIVLALVSDIMLRNVFEVNADLFKIIGGIWIFVIAVYGVIKATNSFLSSKFASRNLLPVPMIFPYISGPGTIAAIIILIQSEGLMIATIIVTLVYLSVLTILQMTPLIRKTIGSKVLSVISRVLYVFICVKSVSLVLSGLKIKLNALPIEFLSININ